MFIVANMESRFPAMRVLWLGREFYKVKHGVTSATVTACRREYLRTAPRSEQCLDRLGSPWSANAFGVLPAVRAGELSAIESAVIV
ncbi:hypothetical protein AVEN_169877-1 [Araneus ventricosus]|uniref:Uncharacterized protein n=1 Tax=Araneus ventricosus TaxID=182803 RepID=A0A4Y2L8Y7_ARAVE|nr:hypothetical protein AVEN_169877-1 [Araneus ventricosus]